MSTLWIVHREARIRNALARLAAAGEAAVLSAPGDPQLSAAAAADVILLGLAGDFEAELQFVHRFAPRLPHARWVLLPERGDVERARSLFDSLGCVVVAYPPDPRSLREIVRAPLRADDPLPLSQRPARDALSNRFARWFADVELPELLRILDPQLADVPVLICGEPGTGRGVLARYIHAFGGTGVGPLVHVVCGAQTSPTDLLEAIVAEARRLPHAPAICTIWLEDVDRLPDASQNRLRGWIEYSLPPGVLGSASLRWLGSAGDDGALTNGLRQTLGAFRIRIPSVRERPERLAAFVGDTARAWCSARGRPPRRFAEDAIAALAEYPWPGNLGELESLVVQTLLTSSADPVRADDLQHLGEAFAPIDAGELGDLIDDEELETAVRALGRQPADEPTASEIEAAAELEPALEPVHTEEISGERLQRLVGAVAHEVRNPLTTIRTFAELLPAQYQDREFREQFAELVGHGVARIEEVVQELARLAALSAPKTEPVDIAGLLGELLEHRRETIHRRRLLVLKELDESQPLALGDAEQLRFAFDAMLDKCLEIVPERGDVYFASKHHDAGLRGLPSLRVLVRFNGPESGRRAPRVAGVSPAENALEFVVAEAVIRAQNGALAVQVGEGDETVLVLDLPAPP